MSSPTVLTRHWDRTTIDGIVLEYVIRGRGEPVVLIHAGVCADFFAPLAEEPALADRYRVLLYHRAGYAGSSRVPGPINIAQHAAHCRLLMNQVGIERAHVVGHSSSAMMALQLALDAPERVQTLALLDPARPALPSAVQREFGETVARPALQRYEAGDWAGAVDLWMQGVCGPDYRVALDRVLPGAIAQAVTDADTFFGQELPAVQEWSFTRGDATRISQPVLVVLGAKSRSSFRERHELLLGWLPHGESFVLPEATHLLQVENPRGMAEALTEFFARHPLSAST